MSGKQNDVNAITTKPFSKLTGLEKAKYLAKVLVFFVTFGFVFPNVFSE